jgi:hypothetical protein
MSNKITRDVYITGENVIKYVHWVFIFSLYLLCGLGVYLNFVNNPELLKTINACVDITLLCILLFEASLLLYLLKYKYNHEYKIQRKAIIILTITEVISIIISLMSDMNYLVVLHTNYHQNEFFYSFQTIIFLSTCRSSL